MNSIYLHNINFVGFLKRSRMIGCLHVSRELGDVEALLVPVQIALDECNDWSNQDLTKDQLLHYLRENGIEVFKTIEDFVKFKKKYPK